MQIVLWETSFDFGQGGRTEFRNMFWRNSSYCCRPRDRSEHVSAAYLLYSFWFVLAGKESPPAWTAIAQLWPHLNSSTVWHYWVAFPLSPERQLHPPFLPCNLFEVLHKAKSSPQAQRILLAQLAVAFSQCVVLLQQLLRDWKVETLFLCMDAAI